LKRAVVRPAQLSAGANGVYDSNVIKKGNDAYTIVARKRSIVTSDGVPMVLNLIMDKAERGQHKLDSRGSARPRPAGQTAAHTVLTNERSRGCGHRRVPFKPQKRGLEWGAQHFFSS